MSADPKARRSGGSWGDRLLLAALGAYGVALWWWRPATPFEQDEVLFLRALDRYDVAKHAPHPPGYPLYVGLGKAVRWVVGEPDTALDLIGVVASMAAVVGVWLLARRLGARRSAAALAACVMAAVPTFAFHAAVGFSDIPGTALAILAAWALVATLDRPGALAPAAALAAAACGVRPQLALVLLPLGAAALAVAARARRWVELARASAAGVAVSLACWLPAVLVTGPGRFGRAFLAASRWAAENEARARLPGAPLDAVARHWLVDPWGAPALALVFWLTVAAGAAVWWRRGRRRLVAVALACVGTYLAAGAFTMGMGEAMRYVLPALPFLALLAGGIAEARPPFAARLLVTGGAAWCVAGLVWIAPLVALRARSPAPAWECLSWVAAHESPERTVVVFDGVFRPHAGYLLGERGFHLEQLRADVAYTNPVPGGAVLFVTRARPLGGEVLLERSWDLDELKPLSRHLYERCLVVRQVGSPGATFSGGFTVVPDGWTLTGSGAVSVPDDAPPQLARVAAGDSALLLAPGGAPQATVPAGGEAFAPLPAGAAGALRVEVPGGGTTRLPGIELFPCDGAAWRLLVSGADRDRAVVPSVAHVQGRMRSLWVTDLLLRNLRADAPLEVTMRWSQRLSLGGGVMKRSKSVGGGATLLLRDVLASDFRAEGAGAMLVSSDGPLLTLWATYDQNAPRTLTEPLFLAPLSDTQAARRGTLDLRYRPGPEGMRSNTAFFNPGADPCGVTVEVRDHEGRRAPSTFLLRLPPWGFDLLDPERLVGPDARKLTGEFDLRFEAERPVHAYVSIVANDSNRTYYEFAGGVPPR